MRAADFIVVFVSANRYWTVWADIESGTWAVRVIGLIVDVYGRFTAFTRMNFAWCLAN
jgi:hypothetical protein